MESYLINLINDILYENTVLVYVIFFISSFLQMVFPPHPGDVILIVQGYVTTLSNKYPVVPVLLNAVTATSLGTYIIYKLGYVKGEAVLEYKIIKRFISKKNQDRARAIFDKYGSFAIIASKFILGINAVIILFAGIFRVKKKVAYPAMFLAIIIHHILFIILGRILGNNLNYVKKVISTYNYVVLGLIAAVIISVLIYRVVKGRQKKAVE